MAATVEDLREFVRSEVDRTWRRVWRPVARLGFLEWCERNIFLRKTETRDYEGRYRPDVVLPMARLWAMFMDSAEWKYLFLTKASQSAASLHALAAIVRQVEVDPCNVVYTIHSADEAGNIGRRLKALMEECEATAGVLDETPDDDKTTRTLRLPGMNIWITGSGSAGAMASKPGVGLILIDEVDKHPQIKGEAASIDLLKQRGKTVRSVKVAAFSTPTTDEGQIWKAVRTGSMHKYHVPCPHCGEMQPMEREGLRWGHLADLAGGYNFEEVRRLTHYECRACKGAIMEDDRKAMLEHGEWRPTNFREVVKEDGTKELVPAWQPGEMSALHSDFLAKWPGSELGNLALETIAAAGQPGKMHDLLNNRFGLPWKSGGVATLSHEQVFSLRGAYRRGGAMFEPHLVAFAADTQDDRWKYVLTVFNKKGDFCLSDWGECLTFEEVKERARDGVEWGGKRYRSTMCLVDEGGHRTREVRRNVLELKPWMFASKGVRLTAGRGTLEWRMFSVDKDGAETLPVLCYDDDGFKRALYRDSIAAAAKRKAHGKAMREGDREVWFPENLTDELVNELVSERLEKTDAGWKWVTKGPNDFGDALKMGLIIHAAAGHMVNRGG